MKYGFVKNTFEDRIMSIKEEKRELEHLFIVYTFENSSIRIAR